MAGKGGFPKPLVYFFVGLILLNLLSGLASDPDFAEDFPLFAAIGAFLLFRFFTSRNGNRDGPWRPFPGYPWTGSGCRERWSLPFPMTLTLPMGTPCH